MRENRAERDSEDARRRPTAATRPIDLRSVVVRYEDRADRCTVAPRDCPEAERTTAWLSADFAAFVDLEEVR